jgi:hypothetical protein
MNTTELKQKISDGISDEELQKFLSNVNSAPHKRKRNYVKNLVDGFIEGYTVPSLWRSVIEAILLLFIIAGVILLCFVHIMDISVGGIFLASILGFLFGKMKK